MIILTVGAAVLVVFQIYGVQIQWRDEKGVGRRDESYLLRLFQNVA